MKATTWLYPGKAGWHFITLPKKQSKEIKKLYGMVASAFGSLPVIVTIGNTKWKTSIFPSKESESYLLPLKADVRKKEKIVTGEKIDFVVEIVA